MRYLRAICRTLQRFTGHCFSGNCFKILILTVYFSSTLNSASVVINEFMASNASFKLESDEENNFPDWLELYNPDDDSANLGGMYITDDPDNLIKWKVPEKISIEGGEYLVFIADNDESEGIFHTNFKINAEAGILCLVDSDGLTIIDSLTYHHQIKNVSFGRYPDGSGHWEFCDSPSPESKNQEGYTGIVPDINFSHEHGFYEQSFQLMLSTPTENAVIYYTVDGSEPRNVTGSDVFRYTDPIKIDKTTCVRAKAYLEGWKSTKTATNTYLFLDDVIHQSAAPRGFPRNWAHTGLGDYEMDPEVVDNPSYRNTIVNDMKSVPSMSLVMDVDDWFGNNGKGIYIEGELEERAVSAELILPDQSEGFQINCAVMIVGGISVDRWKCDKLSMRLKFKSEYGPSNLHYPLFGQDATDVFDTIVLDARMNHSWFYGGGVTVHGRPLNQRDTAQYTRDPLVADIQNLMGGYAPHGRHVHLYINGLYWGLYWIHERPDEHFAASYFGGDEEDYDVLKHGPSIVLNGENTDYINMFEIADDGLASDSQYQLIQHCLDIPNFINYIILNFYLGNWDWADKNWYSTRKKTDPDGRWRYHSWDAEHVIEDLQEDVTDFNDAGGPTQLHQDLTANAFYRTLFADHVYKHCFNDGILTPGSITTLYKQRLQEVDRAVVGESARWGDNRRDVPYTRDVEWVNERDWILNTYFQQRRDIVIDQLRKKGLYPKIEPPQIFINDTLRYGGQVLDGDVLSMTASEGKMYFTNDGSDPVTPINSQQTNQIIVSENADKRVLVPKVNIGVAWRNQLNYDASAWQSCKGNPGGVGYEKGQGYNEYIGLDVLNDMYRTGSNPNPSCYIRILFQVQNDELLNFQTLILNVRYDDGFIAYLNGNLVAKVNAPNSPQWNSSASGSHEADDTAVSFDISNQIGNLAVGQNLLAIHGLNQSTSSSDFIITAELIASDQSGQYMISPGAKEYTEPIVLNQSEIIKVRTINNNDISALKEASFVLPDDLTHLKIIELHYHPLDDEGGDDGDFEFIELKNTGHAALDLSALHFSAGVQYTFPAGTELAAGAFIVLASDSDQFDKRYHFLPFGEYGGNLDNSGEQVILLNATGDTLISFRYNDHHPWPTSPDGEGYSLVSKYGNPDGDPDSPAYWHVSSVIHGSPGTDDLTSDVEHSGSQKPGDFALSQNYPNPFNSSTKIVYTIPKTALVDLIVYDLLGRQVDKLVHKIQRPGVYTIQWDGNNSQGNDVSSGLYFLLFKSEDHVFTRKMLMVR